LITVAILSIIQTDAATNYTIWCVGNGCNKDVAPKTSPGVVLMGGGIDTDEAFEWQISNANGGDFVVLRSTGTDAYNPYIYDLSVSLNKTLNSVRTILFSNKYGAQDPEVLNLIRNAEAVFMAGGDQSSYLSYWVGTPVQSILQDKISTITIGGTSAGCAVLGNWIYTGEVGSITSSEALSNPYDRYMTITSSPFLKFPFLETFITDTHFVTRDRMGRMLTFLARNYKDFNPSNIPILRSVGIDEHTALLLDIHTGDVTTVGAGTAYICSSDHTPQTCKTRTSLTFKGISCHRLSALTNDRYSLSTFSGDGITYPSDVANGAILNRPYGPTA